MRLASADAPVLRLPRPRRDEAAFLPAALEIIESPASPLGRAVALSIAAFLATAIAWASLGQVDIIATAQGRVIPTGNSKVIQPYETGVVRRIAVSDGTAVKAGDVLVELDPTTDASDERQAQFGLMTDRLDIARLTALLSGDLETFRADAGAELRMVTTARQQMAAQAAEHRAKLDGLDRRIAQKQVERGEIATATEKLAMSLPLLTEQRDIRKRLLANEYGSRLTYLQMEQQVVEAEHDLATQRQKRDENEQELAALDREKAATAADYNKGLLADLAKAELSAEEHEQEVRKAALHRDLRTLRAPVDGTVQQLSLHTLGGVVTPAQQLMVVVPNDGGLEIEASLLNKDVGFVRKGQAVEVKVETFTFTRYGLLHGRVASVSRDVVAPRDDDPRGGRQGHPEAGDEKERQARQPAYVAHIDLAEHEIVTENGPVALEPGMAVEAEIKTGRRSVISYFLSPLSRLRQEGLRER